MIFPIPGLVEEANAVVNGCATAPPGRTFSNLLGTMSDGRFTKGPTLTDGGTQIMWSTAGKGNFGSNEKSWVTTDVIQSEEIIDRYFGFNNPILGKKCLHSVS